MTNYRNVPPIQQGDEKECWAASLEWWQRAMRRFPICIKSSLLGKYFDLWDHHGSFDTNSNYGAVSAEGMLKILRDHPWRMDAQYIPSVTLTTRLMNEKLRSGPVILGYYEQRADPPGPHIVVAYGASDEYISVMNPAYPCFEGKPVKHFTLSERVLLGWPRRRH